MKTVAFHLQKGGVGKTTLSGAIAYNASLKGKTVLVDCDPQGNASSWFLKQFNYELADVLSGDILLHDAIINTPSGFDMLPTFGLDGGLKLYGETKLNDEPFVFCDLFEELYKIRYDYVVVDLSPGMGRAERLTLIACDEVVTPMTPEHFSLDGIEIFDSELSKLKKTMKRAPKHDIVVLNAYDARIKQHNEIADTATKLKHKLVTIPVDPVFRKSQAGNVSPQIFGGMKPLTESAINTIGGLLWL